MRVVGKVVGVGGFPAEGAIEGQRSTDRGLETGEGEITILLCPIRLGQGGLGGVWSWWGDVKRSITIGK